MEFKTHLWLYSIYKIVYYIHYTKVALILSMAIYAHQVAAVHSNCLKFRRRGVVRL